MGPREAILLGILQALTEFLPVSSSGHLVLVEHLLGVGEVGLLFDVALHVGTLGAVAVVLRHELKEILASVANAIRDLGRGVPPRTVYADSSGLRMAVLVIVGTIPTGIIGLSLASRIEDTLREPLPVGAMLLVTAVVLMATSKLPRGNRADGDLLIRDALLIGIAQGLAVVPGISRAGTTIAIGLAAGLRRETAARFSFLLSIPAILGAMVLQLGDVSEASPDLLSASLVGATVSMLVGWGALIGLFRVVRAGKLHWFAPYLVVIGGGTVMASLW